MNSLATKQRAPFFVLLRARQADDNQDPKGQGNLELWDKSGERKFHRDKCRVLHLGPQL